MTILSCRICGVEFEAKTARRMYCSQRCKDKGKPSANNGVCAKCGGALQVKAHSAEVPMHARCRTENYGAEHGTTRAFRKGCRCDECRAAKAADNQRFIARHRAEFGVNPSTTWRKRFREVNGFWSDAASWDWIEPRERHAIYARDLWTCWLCSERLDPAGDPNGPKSLTLDHVIPRSKGGTDEPSNLKTACRMCNSLKGVSVVTC